MGRKSTRENKNIYQQSREQAGLSREAAAEKLVSVSSDRIEKIEYETSSPHPDEVLAMADCYRNPALCNYYCSHECPIGQQYVPEVKIKDLTQITLELLNGLNELKKQRERLIEITMDGQISPAEEPDFLRIQEMTERLALSIDALNLWAAQAGVEQETGKNGLENLLY